MEEYCKVCWSVYSSDFLMWQHRHDNVKLVFWLLITSREISGDLKQWTHLNSFPAACLMPSFQNLFDCRPSSMLYGYSQVTHKLQTCSRAMRKKLLSRKEGSKTNELTSWSVGSGFSVGGSVGCCLGAWLQLFVLQRHRFLLKNTR